MNPVMLTFGRAAGVIAPLGAGLPNRMTDPRRARVPPLFKLPPPGPRYPADLSACQHGR